MKRIAVFVAGAALAAGSLWGQKQPQPKSQKEVEAIQAMFQAPDPDARIKAAENLIEKFADTEFKAVALQVATMAAQEKNDFEKVVIYAERTLEADPKNYHAMIILSGALAQRTREHDLDKEEKLSKAEKHASSALELLKTAPKPNPQLDDAQWEGAKKDFGSQAYEALGLAASARKKYDVAITNFKLAVETAATPDAATKIRLASAYNNAAQYTEANTTIDAVLADPQLHPALRQFATTEKQKAQKGLEAKK